MMWVKTESTKTQSSPPQLRRGGAKRRGGAGQTIDFLDQHHPSLGFASALPSSAEEGSFYKAFSTFLFSLLTFLLAGCAVGPRYTPPVPQNPLVPEYKEGGNWKPADPADEIQKGKWWEIFKDLQLNALEEQIDVSNQNLKAAQASFEQARALIRQNRSSFYPSASSGASITGVHQSDNRPVGHATYTDYMVPVNLSYEADVWGRVKYTVEGSRAAAQASAADLEAVNLSMHAELGADYFELHGLDAEQQLLDSTVEAYQKALDLTRNRFNGGIASQADVTKAETQLESTRAQAVEVGIQRAQLEHAIAVLVGKSASTFTLLPAPLTTEPPTIPTGLPSELLERRPDIAAAERRVAAANTQIGIARTAFYPILSLQAPTGLESASFATWLTGPSALFGLGPAAVLPLFDAGRRKAVSDQAKAGYEQATASYQRTVLTAFQDVENTLAETRILEDEAGIQERAVAAAEHSLEVSTNRYKGGLATYLDVSVAQTIALDNQRTAVQILKRRNTTAVQLIRALGGGWRTSDLPSN
jgi:NodT family efflux transporter outer membrane factor (OMF) lipoprotein